jgi:hypothetical protein
MLYEQLNFRNLHSNRLLLLRENIYILISLVVRVVAPQHRGIFSHLVWLKVENIVQAHGLTI